MFKSLPGKGVKCKKVWGGVESAKRKLKSFSDHNTKPRSPVTVTPEPAVKRDRRSAVCGRTGRAKGASKGSAKAQD